MATLYFQQPLLQSSASHDPISLSFLNDIVNQLKPTGSPLDIVPSQLFTQLFSVMGPTLLNLINKCLELGVVLDCLKHASVQPRLKKPNLDSSDASNFRPISNISFLAKNYRESVFSSTTHFLGRLQKLIHSNQALGNFFPLRRLF